MTLEKLRPIDKELAVRTAEVDRRDIRIRQLSIAQDMAREANSPEGVEMIAWLQGLIDGENKERFKADIMKRSAIETLKEYPAPIEEAQAEIRV
jgi:hypothetical protein